MKIYYLVCLVLLPVSVTAKQPTKIAECQQISSDLQRLNCYDKIAEKYAKYDLDPSTPNVDSEAIVLTKEDTFGKSLSEIAEIDSIQSSIIGEFKGWKKGMVVKLTNGQRWKVISRSVGYVRFSDPEVEISKGFMGSFKMKVNGFNIAAKVKRVD